MNKKLICFSLIVLLLLVMGCAYPSLNMVSGAFSGINGRIAFYSNRDGSWQIYSINPDGTDPIQLTFEKKDGEPSWSPDGKKIVFTGWDDYDPEIYVMNDDGTDRVQLTFNEEFDGEPSWSPDGSKIVFISVNPNRDREIFIMNPDGSDQKQITFDMRDAEDPSWSPDGEKIVFNSNRDADQELYIMNPDGSNIKKLTNNGADDWNPSWSPDGKKIVFTSDRRGFNEIFVMNIDGGELTQLTFKKEDVCPAWSPDGSKIVFVRFNTEYYPMVGWQLYVMNADGSEQIQLTNTLAPIFSPSGVDWRPNWQPNNNISYSIFFNTLPANDGSIIFDKFNYNNENVIYESPGLYTIEARPGSGYVFNGWEVNGGLTISEPKSEKTTCVVWGDGELWMLQSKAGKINPLNLWPWIRIDLLVYPDGSGTISSNPEPKYGIITNPWASFYYRNSVVEFTANSMNQSEWEFEGWELSDGIKLSSNPITIPVQEKGYIKAIFRRVEARVEEIPYYSD